MPFFIQFIGAALFGIVGFLAGGMITIQIGEEPMNTGFLFMMIGALIGYFLARGLLPLFENHDDAEHPEHPEHAQHGTE